MAKKPAGPRILIADGERPFRRILKATLVTEGFKLFEAVDGKSALEALIAARPDVVILDLCLPDLDGIEVTREIRARSAVPVIILSARNKETDKVSALDAGADDYITKPFSTPELLARVRAVLRRWVPQGKNQIFKTGALTLNIERRAVQIAGKSARLTPTEYDVLKALASRAGKVVSREKLFQEIWNKADGAGRVDHLLRVTISNLRSKIEPHPSRPAYILTEPGVGYRLMLGDPESL